MSNDGAWAVVRIPKRMLEEVQDIIQDHPEKGYRSVSAFVADAIRRRIENHKK